MLSTYTPRLRSTPGTILLAHACCWPHQHVRGAAGKCHLWLEDEAAPFSPSFGWKTRISAELGCGGRNAENCWGAKLKPRNSQMPHINASFHVTHDNEHLHCCTFSAAETLPPPTAFILNHRSTDGYQLIIWMPHLYRLFCIYFRNNNPSYLLQRQYNTTLFPLLLWALQVLYCSCLWSKWLSFIIKP